MSAGVGGHDQHLFPIRPVGKSARRFVAFGTVPILFVSLLAAAAVPASAATSFVPITKGDVIVSNNTEVSEYTPTGTLVQTMTDIHIFLVGLWLLLALVFTVSAVTRLTEEPLAPARRIQEAYAKENDTNDR